MHTTSVYNPEDLGIDFEDRVVVSMIGGSFRLKDGEVKQKQKG